MKMNTENDYNVAVRYRTVRKHLDSLGYKHSITLDALPLIEKLLADLLQTTESLKHFKSIAQENIEAHSQLQSAIDPYKCDNARLVEECNQLHSDFLKAKESHQKQIKDLKKEIHKLEHECNDLQLASSRNLQKIKELETESSRKSKKILELQGKCLKPTISNVGLASKKRPCYPLRRAVLESDPLPKTGSKSQPLPNLSTVEPKVVDLLSMADHKMNCLSHEVTKLKEELLLQTDNVQTLESQLTAKEKEIIRLKKLLEGGRPYSAVSKDCPCKKVENSFMQSTDNVDLHELEILQQEKFELEQQLKEALNKQHDAMTQALKLADRNEELEKELRDIDHIALAVEADCNSVVKENNERVSKLQQKLEDVMTQVHNLEGELTVEHREVQELRADLEACRLEKRNIQRNLESALDEKKHMIDRINELTVIEKNLNDEIERLARENEKQRQDIIQLQYSNKLLKEQMHIKEMLQADDGGGSKEAKEKGTKNDFNRGQNGIDIQDIYRRDVYNINRAEYENIRKQLDEKESRLSNLEQGVEKLKRERDFYKNEYNNMKEYHNRTIEKDHDDLWSRIRELKCQLSEKESALDELQREKNELFREKTNLETRLQSYKTEHKHPHRPCNICKRGTSCNCSPPTFKDTNKAKSIIERLEHERDMARGDIERLIEERDALRERLKLAAEAHTSEQRRLRENLTEVETRLKQIEKERQELLLTQGARRATINGLEDQLEDVREELKRTKQELASQRTQYFQLRALQDQTDQALGDTQNQLTQSKSELNKALDRNRTMERQQQQLEDQVKDLQQEINNLKINMTHLDHEKDQLLMVLDEKTERIAALEREMMLKDQQVLGSDQQIRELQHKNELTVEQAAEQERQVRSIQMEMENLQRQLQTASYDRENIIQENRRIQDDLAACTCEVRNLQRELEASRAESFDLKRQLQTYVSEVRRAEELLNRKENERTEMLNHFRSLSLEATVLENNNHSLESEAAEARGALQTARDRLMDLERQLADKDSLISGYETQISELTQNVASMETQLRQHAEQRQRTEADLTAVRDLCVKLDQQKDTLMHQLDDKDSLKTQYDMQISKLKAEQTIIQDQMSRDRATVERLEILLDQARQESITVQANNQELQNEMSRLRTKMSELQSKLSSESAKLRQYQTQAAEYCKQISELRRQVTNERFDRARMEEENRRHSESHEDPSKQITVPLPNNRIPNGSNDTACRSLQNERNEEYSAISHSNRMKTVNSFPLSHSAYTAESNDFRRGHRNEIYRDVPCVNIILRSDCTMKSTQYNCLQKNTDQSESKIVKQSKGDTETTLGISDFNLPQEKCEHIAVNTNESPNLLPISRVQCEGTSAQDRKAVTFTSIQTIPHTSSELPSYRSKYSNETSYFNQNPLDLVRKRLVYSEAEINTNKEEVEGPMRYKESIWKTYPVIKLENSTRKVYGDNVISTKKSISTFMEADEPVKHITVTKTVLTPTKQKSAKDCSCICSHAVPYSNQTLMKDKMVEGNIQLGLLRDYEKNDKKQEAPFDYDKNVSDITTSKKAGEKNANCGINATCDSMRYSTLNMEQKTEYESLTRDLKSKSNATVKFYHSTPERKLESPVSKNLLSEKDLNYCTDISCNAINNRTTGLIRDTKSVNTAVSVKSVGTITNNTLTAQKDLYYSKVKQEPKGTIDTTMNTLEGILTGIKSLNDKSITKHNAHSYQDGSIRCKDMDCNVTGMNNKLSTGCMKPECLRMLEEIKECTKMLEEQLTIMNKNMKTKRSRNSYGDKQRKDIITQKPEKENVCVQEPSLNNFKHIKHMQNLRMKPRNNLDVQQIELQDKTYQETGKKTAWTKETLQIPKYHGKQERSESSKKMLHKFESKNNSNMNQSSSLKGVRQREKDQWTKSYTIDFSNFEPLAASTFRDKDPSSGNRHVCPAIGQTSIVSNRNSERWQKKETRLTELIRHPSKRRERTISLGNVKGMQGCSSCPEKTIVMLLLTRGVHNSYLKSKYKRLEFMNFKPKCNNGDQILKRRKAQAPTVFRELKSVQCKIENCSNSAENAYGNFTDNPTVNSKVSNLWATVCTQSSNLYITTATSVSDVNFMNYSSNCIKAKPARSGTCILS